VAFGETSSAQTTYKSPFSVKGRSSFPQPDQGSLIITIDRLYATKINVQRTWWAYRKSQILCSRTLESAGQSDGDPAIVTNYPKYRHNL
jgi:hypothetical protein